MSGFKLNAEQASNFFYIKKSVTQYVDARLSSNGEVSNGCNLTFDVVKRVWFFYPKFDRKFNPGCPASILQNFSVNVFCSIASCDAADYLRIKMDFYFIADINLRSSLGFKGCPYILYVSSCKLWPDVDKSVKSIFFATHMALMMSPLLYDLKFSFKRKSFKRCFMIQKSLCSFQLGNPQAPTIINSRIIFRHSTKVNLFLQIEFVE